MTPVLFAHKCISELVHEGGQKIFRGG